LLCPVQIRSDVKVYEYGIVIMEVDRIRELGKLLRAGAVATPKGIELRSVDLGITVAVRQVINGCSSFGIDCAHAMVEQHTLVIVHVAGLRRPREKVTRQLEHVVYTAVFCRIHAELGGEHTWVRSP